MFSQSTTDSYDCLEILAAGKAVSEQSEGFRWIGWEIDNPSEQSSFATWKLDANASAKFVQRYLTLLQNRWLPSDP